MNEHTIKKFLFSQAKDFDTDRSGSQTGLDDSDTDRSGSQTGLDGSSQDGSIF